MILRGLRRLAIVLGVVVALSAAAGLGIGALRDTGTWQSLAIGFYLGGAVSVIAAMFSRPVIGAYGEFGGVSEVRESFGSRWIYLAVGVFLIALGILSETLVPADPPSSPAV